ncbi:MAG: helix-turn-helix transcriptional regulator [Oscillospiraceae bacterium]|nr:helix-turn-helix transcriptional regulator [Oscillospiraceae bacterium]
MLISNLCEIGNKLYKTRKNKGLTQAEVAEKAELSDRTYADIERGSTNMRLETLLKICNALNITPNDILVIDNNIEITEQDIAETIKNCSNNEKETALKLLSVYVDSLK